MNRTPEEYAPRATQSAVVVAVPEAEPVVAEHRRRLDVAASWGVPAHVTVLYPFVRPDLLDDAVLARLAAAVAGVAAFDCVLERCGWFGEQVLWLDPRPAAPFVELVERVAAAFPDHPPYGGAHPDVVPHLTLGEARRGSLEELRAAEAAVVPHLPVRAHVREVRLIAGSDQPHSWRTRARLPLGAR